MEAASGQEQFHLAKRAIAYASNHSTGYFSSDRIEKVFLKHAEKIEAKLAPSFQEGSVLHVMSSAHAKGGHSQVVLRWIQRSQDKQHGLVLTEQEKQDLPLDFLNLLSEKSVFSLAQEGGDHEKARALRELASRYETIIVYVNMDDVIPLLAFGSKTFERPVVHYNHANHRFWVGGSVADLVVEFSSWGEEITQKRRGLSSTYLLGIPMDMPKLSLTAQELKKKHGLPLDKKLIVSSGSNYKYRPIEDFNIFRIAHDACERNPDSYFLIVGLTDDKCYGYESLVKKSGRIELRKPVSHQELMELYGAADLVLDSFPMAGGTAMLDAAALNKALLHLDCPTNQLDYLIRFEGFCRDTAELHQKLDKLLKDPVAREQNAQSVQDELKASGQMPQQWPQQMQRLYSKLPKKHTVRPPKTPEAFTFEAIDAYLYLERNYRKPLCVWPGFLELYKLKEQEAAFFELYSCLSKKPWVVKLVKKK